MNTTYDVRIYSVLKRPDSKSNPYRIRWSVAGQRFYKAYRTAGLANGFRSKLLRAAAEGEAFDVELGLPVSMARTEREKAAAAAGEQASTFLQLVTEYADYKWPRLSANGRRSVAEGLRDIALFLYPAPPAWLGVEGMTRALMRWVFNAAARKAAQTEVERAGGDGAVVPDAFAPALEWLRESSPLAADLEKLETVRQLLDALTWTRDDKRASPNYFARRRQVLSNLLVYAVTKGHFTQNPLTDPKLNWERPTDMKVDHAVDPREVGSPETVRRMLTAVTYVGTLQGPRLAAYFATMYFGMLRPEEVNELRKVDCTLPETGWGRLIFGEAAPAAGKQWTDDGKAHERRQLKHRSPDSVRVVSIPPELVKMLRWHIATFGAATDGRLFRTIRRDGYLPPSTICRVWSLARGFGLTPAERSTKLLRHPYTLRKSGISARRTANIPSRDVADEAGNSVAVLEQTYSFRLSGFDTRWQRQMDAVLDSPTDDEDDETRAQDGHGEPPEAA